MPLPLRRFVFAFFVTAAAVESGDPPGPQNLLSGTIQCGQTKLGPGGNKQTGWDRPCTEILMGSQYGLSGQMWGRLQVVFDFSQSKNLGGIKSDCQPLTKECTISTSDDNNNWNKRASEKKLDDVKFEPAVRARYAKFDCPDTHGNNGFHAQFYESSSRGPPSPGDPGGGDGGSGSSGSCSGGCVFLILFFCGGFVYVAGGTVYNYKKHELRGQEALPHAAFWKDVPLLVKDGAVYAVAQVRGRVGGYSSV